MNTGGPGPAGRDDCILCAIAGGAAPASFVYEDDQVVGILSLDQPTGFKTLVLPRAHVETIYELSGDQAGRIFRAAVRIACAVREASGCAGLNVVQSNGVVAGQDVPHFHMHLLPRNDGDGIQLDWPAREVDRERLDAMAADIVRNMRTG